ncbi:MAG TPA: anthrone oxygenase family protein [Pseudoxanthomonas sp.]
MSALWLTVLLWFSALGCGVLAGLFFAFSAFIMRALGRLPPAAGIAAMNAINDAILRSLFMPLFLGTTLSAAALAVIAALRWEQPGAAAMFSGGVIHVVGMFACTMFIEVPQNNALQRVDPDSEAALPIWRRYLTRWTAWNHVRTLACTAACALFVAALVARAEPIQRPDRPSGSTGFSGAHALAIETDHRDIPRNRE